jgi:glycine betaine catabolism B
MIEDRASPVLWQTCVIERIVQQTPSIKSFFLQPETPLRHVAGQHLDVRLTASDGYTAMRSYSIASFPSFSSVIELAIERLPAGEVSAYFHDIAVVGDKIEIRGPLGGHFLWPEPATGPVLLVGAGSGVVPLMAMLRQRHASSKTVPAALLLSSRTSRDTLFLDELLSMERDDPNFHLALATTRSAPPRASDFSRRIDSEMVSAVVAKLPGAPAHAFVCGSNAFVNVATDGALAAGVDAQVIKTERYGG